MRRILTSLGLAASLLFAPASSLLAQNNGNLAPSSANGQTAGTANWSTDQLLTSTVHQAWLLSGKNEATFFEMVTQLAEISAKNRNLQLPETAAAGRQVGQRIKLAAKSDTGQLLFAVVDAAVRKVGTPLPASAGQ
ncbi:MAG: hypothetical protein ACRYFU_03400 [Janthinobacterium lividum]